MLDYSKMPIRKRIEDMRKYLDVCKEMESMLPDKINLLNMAIDALEDEHEKTRRMNNRRHVYAVRIYLKDGYRPMADLAFGDGGRTNGEIVTIEWDRPDEREKYYIDSYTFIWDDREPVQSQSFQEYANGHNNSYGG